MRKNHITKSIVPCLLFISLFSLASPSFSGEVLQDLPTTINPDSKYLFYLHGGIVERKGVEWAESKVFGFYQYKEILKVLAKHGFVVISEARSADTNIKSYAKKIANQVNVLIEKGAPAKNITVAGTTKGGKITLVASSLVGNGSVNYVILAGCISDTKTFINEYGIDLKGRVLSIFDYKDNTFSSCGDMFENSSGGLEHNEIILKDGGRRGVFFEPKDLWIKPMMNWIK